MRARFAAIVVVLGLAFAGDGRAQSSQYRRNPNWATLPAGVTWREVTGVEPGSGRQHLRPASLLPSGIFITKDDTIYVADPESGTSAPNSATGMKKGIRIGSAKDGRVTGFIEDLESGTAPSGAEGVGVGSSSTSNTS
jgi:hypothetical protein